ncbi:uncharacterized protein CMU_030040 [Cryptosporidium muris RN66]|uniref:RAVE complex protein Rav1 C-terminal domain-containing protein n=1 Tax=Cryptosporidium muris (strain RN66) TaxID=441375 RepID=B6AI87_CRYMR|nr:uncharacterized protein CMU_030040 [Cryptosporidium muris RN66]EEA07928.1 hypothetical protein, conserved [Cryptosporidium muris RN66]|eukprot:XP_002142277.1 hypothetical protein [Cryptosporidium muris RN66]
MCNKGHKNCRTIDIVHPKWPLFAICNDNRTTKILSTSSGKLVQIIGADSKSCVYSLCWHIDSLTLCIGYENYIDIWMCSEEYKTLQLIEEGLSAPTFDIEHETFINQTTCTQSQESDSFVTEENIFNDIFGINLSKRINYLWYKKYNEIIFIHVKRIDLLMNNFIGPVVKLHWFHNSMLMAYHFQLEDSKACLSFWKATFDIFNLDIYNDIKSRRKYHKSSQLVPGELPTIFCTVFVDVLPHPILSCGIWDDSNGNSFRNRINNIPIISVDPSERFISIYQHKSSYLFIWRYENVEMYNNPDLFPYVYNPLKSLSSKLPTTIDDISLSLINIKESENLSISQDKVLGFEFYGGFINPPNSFKNQKICFDDEYLIDVHWKHTNLEYPEDIYPGKAIQAILSTVSYYNAILYIRLWRESSFYKACKFNQICCVRLDYDCIINPIAYIHWLMPIDLSVSNDLPEKLFCGGYYNLPYLNSIRYPSSIDDMNYCNSIHPPHVYEDDSIICCIPFIPLFSTGHSEDLFLTDIDNFGENSCNSTDMFALCFNGYIHWFYISNLYSENDEMYPNVYEFSKKLASMSNGANYNIHKIIDIRSLCTPQYNNDKGKITPFSLVGQLLDGSIVIYTYNNSWNFVNYIPSENTNVMWNNDTSQEYMQNKDLVTGRSLVELPFSTNSLLITDNSSLYLLSSEFEVLAKFQYMKVTEQKMDISLNSNRDPAYYKKDTSCILYKNMNMKWRELQVIDFLLNIPKPFSKPYYSLFLALFNQSQYICLIALDYTMLVGYPFIEMKNLVVKPLCNEELDKYLNDSEYILHVDIIKVLFNFHDFKEVSHNYRILMLDIFNDLDYISDNMGFIFVCVVEEFSQCNSKHIIFFKLVVTNMYEIHVLPPFIPCIEQLDGIFQLFHSCKSTDSDNILFITSTNYIDKEIIKKRQEYSEFNEEFGYESIEDDSFKRSHLKLHICSINNNIDNNNKEDIIIKQVIYLNISKELGDVKISSIKLLDYHVIVLYENSTILFYSLFSVDLNNWTNISCNSDTDTLPNSLYYPVFSVISASQKICLGTLGFNISSTKTSITDISHYLDGTSHSLGKQDIEVQDYTMSLSIVRECDHYCCFISRENNMTQINDWICMIWNKHLCKWDLINLDILGNISWKYVFAIQQFKLASLIFEHGKLKPVVLSGIPEFSIKSNLNKITGSSFESTIKKSYCLYDPTQLEQFVFSFNASKQIFAKELIETIKKKLFENNESDKCEEFCMITPDLGMIPSDLSKVNIDNLKKSKAEIFDIFSDDNLAHHSNTNFTPNLTKEMITSRINLKNQLSMSESEIEILCALIDTCENSENDIFFSDFSNPLANISKFEEYLLERFITRMSYIDQKKRIYFSYNKDELNSESSESKDNTNKSSDTHMSIKYFDTDNMLNCHGTYQKIKTSKLDKTGFIDTKPRNLKLSSEDICWISLCYDENLVNRIFQYAVNTNQLDWSILKSWGIGYWVNKCSILRQFISLWIQKLYHCYINKIRREYQSASCNIINTTTIYCAEKEPPSSESSVNIKDLSDTLIVFYTVLGKLNIVSTIFKLLKKVNVVEFLQNFTGEETQKKQAIKNGYYLIRQRSYYWSLTFFILGGAYREIVNVCLQYLRDPQLALVILKLSMDTTPELLSSPIKDLRDGLYICNESDGFDNLTSLESSEDRMKCIYNTLLNVLLSQLWNSALTHHDPWLGILVILQIYNSNPSNNISDIYIQSIVIKLGSPKYFYSLCKNESQLITIFDNNIGFDNSQLLASTTSVNKSSTDDLTPIFDLNYSYMHPEHLRLFRKYIYSRYRYYYPLQDPEKPSGLLFYLNNSFQPPNCTNSNMSNFIDNDKVLSTEYVIDIICHYIKKDCNPYHYLGWFKYVETNIQLNPKSKDYHRYNVVRPIVISNIAQFLQYIVRYHSGRYVDVPIFLWFSSFMSYNRSLQTFFVDSIFSLVGYYSARDFLIFIIKNLASKIGIETPYIEEELLELLDLIIYQIEIENCQESLRIKLEMSVGEFYSELFNTLGYYTECNLDHIQVNLLEILWPLLRLLIITLYMARYKYDSYVLLKIWILLFLLKNSDSGEKYIQTILKFCRWTIITFSIYCDYFNYNNEKDLKHVYLLYKCMLREIPTDNKLETNFMEAFDKNNCQAYHFNLLEIASFDIIHQTILLICQEQFIEDLRNLLSKYPDVENSETIGSYFFTLLLALEYHFYYKRRRRWLLELYPLYPLLLAYFESRDKHLNDKLVPVPLLFISNTSKNPLFDIFRIFWDYFRVYNRILLGFCRDQDIITVSHRQRPLNIMYNTLLRSLKLWYPFTNYNEEISIDVSGKNYSLSLSRIDTIAIQPLSLGSPATLLGTQSTDSLMGMSSEQNMTSFHSSYYPPPFMLNITIQNNYIQNEVKGYHPVNSLFPKDPYLRWYINCKSFVDLFYMSHVLIEDCKNNKNSPFLIFKYTKSDLKPQLMVNSKLYDLHPRTFEDLESVRNIKNYEIDFLLNKNSEWFSSKTVILEFMLNSLLNFRHNINHPINVISYIDRIYISDIPEEIEPGYNIFGKLGDIAVGIHEITSSNLQSQSSLTSYINLYYKSETIEYIEVYNELMLDICKVQQKTAKALICGHLVSITNRESIPILLPCWKYANTRNSIPKPLCKSHFSLNNKSNEPQRNNKKSSNVGYILNVSWCPFGKRIILSTSCGYILVYNIKNKGSKPLVPTIEFAVHKNDCYWANIIDKSCRYIASSGNGLPLSGSLYRSNTTTHSIIRSDTLTLAEFMGDNPFTLNSYDTSSILSDENCLCIWDIWPNSFTYSKRSMGDNNHTISYTPDLLLAIESPPIIQMSIWTDRQVMFYLAKTGLLWCISYSKGRQNLTPFSLKLAQKNVIIMKLSFEKIPSIGYTLPVSLGRLTTISSDGFCVIHNVIYPLQEPVSSIKLIPKIKFVCNYSPSNNPFHIITNNNFTSTSQSNNIFKKVKFIDESTIIVIDIEDKCKIIKLSPFYY